MAHRGRGIRAPTPRCCTNRHWPTRSGLYTLCTDKTFRNVVVSSTQRRTSRATRHRLGLTGRRDASCPPAQVKRQCWPEQGAEPRLPARGHART